jgi:Flp pilus assembly pilin Flp
VRFFTNRTWMQTRFTSGERGAALVEYAVLIGLIAGVGLPGISFVGTSVRNQLEQVAEQTAPEARPPGECDDRGNQGDHGNNDGDQEDGNHDPGNQGNGNGGSQANGNGGNGYPCGNQGDHGNNDGDQEDGNHDPGNQGNGNGQP